jgi:hypothetical protein
MGEEVRKMPSMCTQHPSDYPFVLQPRQFLGAQAAKLPPYLFICHHGLSVDAKRPFPILQPFEATNNL